ncbi:MAG: hypothetical protein CMI79_06775 [Candidatus Pelagibacter sp.]|nr:hypothetical protein [Candidatus Pelagibacter sp.]
MIDIQVYSDLHLEKLDHNIELEKCSEILFLAGDIGRIDDSKYEVFLNTCCHKWKLVVSVLGNNEYYSTTESMDELFIRYKKLYSKYSNAYLLEQECINLGNINIIGTTSWGDFHKGHIGGSPTKIMLRTEEGNLKQIGCENINILHKKCKKWILDSIDKSKYNIILTHFPLTLENEHVRQKKHRLENRKVLDEFGCELELTGDNITCISGHTHYSHNFVKNNVQYISNQFGYDKEKGKTKYSKKGQFIIFKESKI